MLVKKTLIHTTVIGYLSASISYRFVNLFYEYALNNVRKIYTGSDYEDESLGHYVVREIEYVKKRQERDRLSAERSHRKRYIEQHGYPPEEALEHRIIIPKAPAEPRIIADEYRKLRRFVARTRYQLDRKGIVRKFPLSARYGNVESGEPEIVLTKGISGKLPFGAILPEDEYLKYLQQMFSKLEKLSNKEIVLLDEKKKEQSQKWHQYYLEHKEEYRKYGATYREAHKEEIAEYQRQYYSEHQEHLRAYARKHLEEHKGEINAKRRVRRRENLDKIKAQKKANYELHKDEINRRQRQWRKDRPEEAKEKDNAHYERYGKTEKYSEQKRQYRLENRERLREKNKLFREAHKEELAERRKQKRLADQERAKIDPEFAEEYEKRLEKRRESQRRYQERNRERINAEKREKRAEQRRLAFESAKEDKA